MAITYNKVINEALKLLGAVLGATPATADTNYLATPSVSTVIGPDFLPSQVQDAVVAAVGEIVEAIATTPLHPERARFADETAALANLDPIPRTGSASGKLIIGLPGVIKDSVNFKALEPLDLDRVRSFNEFPVIYGGADSYWYAINSGRIEHTRTAVVIEVCVYERPTVFNDIDLDDHHEGGLVQGAVAKVALTESLFQPLFEGANAAWQAHLAGIRAYVNPLGYGKAQAAPSST